MKCFIKKILILILCACLFILLLYFLINPLFLSFNRLFILRKFTNIEYAKNYYQIVSSFFTVIITVLGLFLGYLYFHSRLQFDDSISNRDRKWKNLECIIKELNIFDSLVDSVISKRFSTQKELHTLRCKIERSFENIEIMLEQNQNLLNLKDEDIKRILNVNSFVDNNDILMRIKNSKLNTEVLSSLKDEYIGYIQDARRVCYGNIQ